MILNNPPHQILNLHFKILIMHHLHQNHLFDHIHQLMIKHIHHHFNVIHPYVKQCQQIHNIIDHYHHTTTNKYLDDNEDILSSHPSLTKVYMNKSFALRRQRSNLVPSTSKPVQQQQQQQTVSKPLPTRQLLKPTPSIPSTSLSTNNSSGQTNRAVELRRARAQAKIEELAQRTRQQLQKTEQHNDIMSASWHSNASSTSKKDISHLRSNPRANNNNNIFHLKNKIC